MCNNPNYFPNIIDVFTGKMVPIPCHKCQGCRIDRISVWERRCSYEMIQGRNAFVTLTYDNYHLKWNKGSVYPTICDDDFVKFKDNLRYRIRLLKELPPMCRRDYKICACSEYGEERERPHFHLLVFGLDFKEFASVFEDSWRQGICDVGPIRRGGVRYVLDYINTQTFGESKHINFTDHGRDFPKMYFSRGLGKGWFLSQYDNLQKYGMAKIGSRFVPIDTYWKNKLLKFNYETLDKHFSRHLSYQQEMDNFAKSLGYPDYDYYLRGARKALESCYEKSMLKKHVPSSRVSDSLSVPKYNPFASLMLDYKKTHPIFDLTSRF